MSTVIIASSAGAHVTLQYFSGNYTTLSNQLARQTMRSIFADTAIPATNVNGIVPAVPIGKPARSSRSRLGLQS